jgi:hypothetical protein
LRDGRLRVNDATVVAVFVVSAPRHFGGKFVLRRRGLPLPAFQGQFELIQYPRGALGPWFVAVAVQLLDLRLMSGSTPGHRIGELAQPQPPRVQNDQGRFQRSTGFNIISFHEADRITKSAICGDFFIAGTVGGGRSTPGSHSDIDRDKVNWNNRSVGRHYRNQEVVDLPGDKKPR